MGRIYWEFDAYLFKIRHEFRIKSPSFIKEALEVTVNNFHDRLVLIDNLQRELENEYRTIH